MSGAFRIEKGEKRGREDGRVLPFLATIWEGRLLTCGGKQRARRGKAAHRDMAVPRQASAWCYQPDDVSLSTGRVETLQSGLSERLNMC